MTKEKSCGALVYRWHEDKVQFLLIIHRMGGHWSYPKGHVEEGENERETALREVKEETGLTIELHPGYRNMVTYSPRPGVIKDVVYFLGHAEDSTITIQEEELSAADWFDIADCKSRLTYDNDFMLLKKAVKYLKREGIYPRKVKH